ncbi:tyrosine-protein phosphatase [Rhodococcus sp. NPDC058514]|uniref:tyrosine-protein phosphatase n=1 Tax=unclassified Rhodococcus (in: high G+C Gram-positive bacteria) TaxID=192944 RepID=UPI00364A5122
MSVERLRYAPSRAPTAPLEDTHAFRHCSTFPARRRDDHGGDHGRLRHRPGRARACAGRSYRSNVLRPNGTDLATLTGLRLAAVYDLRTPDAVAEDPDILPPGVGYANIDIFGRDLESEGVRTIRSAADARAFMESMNRGFVHNEHERGAYARLFTELANTQGPPLFHCNSGKDRTGWAAAILQSIAGADRATIMRDYVLTNEYSAETIKKKNEKLVAALGAERAPWYAPMMGVEKSYLEAGFAALDAEYGTVDKYLTEGLGLSGDTLARLKHKLVA